MASFLENKSRMAQQGGLAAQYGGAPTVEQLMAAREYAPAEPTQDVGIGYGLTPEDFIGTGIDPRQLSDRELQSIGAMKSMKGSPVTPPNQGLAASFQ